MTPKEKAQELFDKFNNPDTTNYPYIHDAQQCALITIEEILEEVDEILEALKVFDITFNYILIRDYWLEVKQEIKKL